MIVTVLAACFTGTAHAAYAPVLEELRDERRAAIRLHVKKCLPTLVYAVPAREVAVWNRAIRLREARRDRVRAQYAGTHRCGPLSIHAYERIPFWVRDAFLQIHTCEGSWRDTGDPYWGGLQMDRSFMGSYGADAIRMYGGYAHLWPPHVQIIVAWRAWRTRGFQPWPTCARRAGLI